MSTDEGLHSRLETLVFHDRVGERKALLILQEEGYTISLRTIQRLRHQLKINRRAPVCTTTATEVVR